MIYIPQYAAALVSRNKVLAHPASIDSIPTSANQEDHVSMGTIAARKAAVIISRVQSVLGVELMCSCQAVAFKGAEKLAPGTKAAYDMVRSRVPYMDKDRIFQTDMDDLAAMIRDSRILDCVERVVGKLDQVLWHPLFSSLSL